MSDDKEFSSLATDGRYILFVNSLTPPDKEIPLNHYRYVFHPGVGGKQGCHSFFRLYRVEYTQEKDGMGITHSMLKWYPVDVKSHCVAAMVQLCDSMSAIEEMLDEHN